MYYVGRVAVVRMDAHNGMRISKVNFSVGCPSGMANASFAVFLDKFTYGKFFLTRSAKFAEAIGPAPTYFLAVLHPVLKTNPEGVIATVFKSFESFDKKGIRGLIARYRCYATNNPPTFIRKSRP